MVIMINIYIIVNHKSSVIVRMNLQVKPCVTSQSRDLRTNRKACWDFRPMRRSYFKFLKKGGKKFGPMRIEYSCSLQRRHSGAWPPLWGGSMTPEPGLYESYIYIKQCTMYNGQCTVYTVLARRPGWPGQPAWPALKTRPALVFRVNRVLHKKNLNKQNKWV